MRANMQQKVIFYLVMYFCNLKVLTKNFSDHFRIKIKLFRGSIFLFVWRLKPEERRSRPKSSKRRPAAPQEYEYYDEPQFFPVRRNGGTTEGVGPTPSHPPSLPLKEGRGRIIFLMAQKGWERSLTLPVWRNEVQLNNERGGNRPPPPSLPSL